MERLGEILIRHHQVPTSTIEGAVRAQRAVGRKLGDVLLVIGAIREDELARALAYQSRLPVALNVARTEIDPEVLRLIPPVIAAWERVVPVSRTPGDDRDLLLLAMEDPTDEALCLEIEALTGCEVQPAIASESDLDAAIAHHYAGRDSGPVPESVIYGDTAV